MDPSIAARFNQLDSRRLALVERARALPKDKQNLRASGKAFSPAQAIMHLAITDQTSVARMRKKDPSQLRGLKSKPTFIFRRVVDGMKNPVKRMGTPPNMTPGPNVNLEEAVLAWEESSKELSGFFEKAKTPDSVMQKFFPFGALSANDLLDLYEAHMNYHEKFLEAD